MKFSLRRKQDLLTHTERTIPAISILVESDDEHLQDNKLQKKKKKIVTKHTNRQGPVGEDSDQDDECVEFQSVHRKRKLYRNDRTNSSSNERQETSILNLPISLATIDDDTLLTRKQSKIGILNSAVLVNSHFMIFRP